MGKKTLTVGLPEAKTAGEPALKPETRQFNLCQEMYDNLGTTAQALGISVSRVYRFRQGTWPISEKFITGTEKAFPGYRLDDPFCVVPSGKHYDGR